MIQFADKSASAWTYREGVHYINATQITTPEERDDLVASISALEPTSHFTSSLLELGIAQASAALASSSATDKHMVVLTAGEYRLPEPCPPLCLDGSTDCTSVSSSITDEVCDAQINGADNPLVYSTCLGTCNRVCQIRHAFDQALDAGYDVSVVQLGRDWSNNLGDVLDCEEWYLPYEIDPYVVGTGWTVRSPAPAQTADEYYCYDPTYGPMQPDRAGFLKELVNWKQACDPDQANGIALANPPPTRKRGHYARMEPFFRMSAPSESTDLRNIDTHIASTPWDCAQQIAGWFCEMPCTNSDNDDICDLCDNCPTTTNQNQRDCDLNGQGDACQWPNLTCTGSAPTDTDCDGIPNDEDVCEGGDDCFVNKWHQEAECEDPNDPSGCSLCDCDHDCVDDACTAAIEISDYLLDPENWDTNPADGIPDWDEGDANGVGRLDGVPDCCMDGSCGAYGQFCDRFPYICDVPELAIDQGGEYTESFDNMATGAFFPTGETNDSGWWISDTAYSEQAQIVDFGSGDLGVQISSDDDDQPWFVEGPGFHTPLGGCLNTTCEFSRRGLWSIVAVDLRLRVNSSADGGGFDIYVLDPMDTDFAEAKRAHVKLRHDAVYATGDMLFERANQDPDIHQYTGISQFEYDEWFTLTIIINAARPYRGGECIRSGDFDTVSFRLLSPTWDRYVDETYELSVPEAEESRGIQLQFVTTPPTQTAVSDTLDIASITFRPSDPCEWHQPDNPCSNGVCRCEGSRWGASWTCITGTQCGNWTLDAGEQCDPPDGLHCTETCEWMCDDGITQGEDLTTCPWFINPTACGSGAESCDRPGKALSETVCHDKCGQEVPCFCSTDCGEEPTCCGAPGRECGDGIVCNEPSLCGPNACHEECDDGGPSISCDENCKWRSGIPVAKIRSSRRKGSE